MRIANLSSFECIFSMDTDISSVTSHTAFSDFHRKDLWTPIGAQNLNSRLTQPVQSVSRERFRCSLRRSLKYHDSGNENGSLCCFAHNSTTGPVRRQWRWALLRLLSAAILDSFIDCGSESFPTQDAASPAQSLLPVTCVCFTRVLDFEFRCMFAA